MSVAKRGERHATSGMNGGMMRGAYQLQAEDGECSTGHAGWAARVGEEDHGQPVSAGPRVFLATRAGKHVEPWAALRWRPVGNCTWTRRAPLAFMLLPRAVLDGWCSMGGRRRRIPTAGRAQSSL